jgi:hypothetical protein
MTKGSVKRGLPSRFVEGEVARQTPQATWGLVLLGTRGHNHYRNPRWQVTYLVEFRRWGSVPHTIKESALIKVIWTFTGYVDKPSETR